MNMMMMKRQNILIVLMMMKHQNILIILMMPLLHLIQAPSIIISMDLQLHLQDLPILPDQLVPHLVLPDLLIPLLILLDQVKPPLLLNQFIHQVLLLPLNLGTF